MANAVLQYSYTVHRLSNTYRGKLELPGGIQRAPARATCNIVLPKREVVRHGVKGAFHHHALASDDAWRAHHGSRDAMDDNKLLTEIMRLGPGLRLLSHFDTAVRLQICRNNPYFTVGVAAIKFAAAHLLVVGDGVNPSGGSGRGRFVGEVYAMLNSVPRKHQHSATLLFAPHKNITVCAAAEEGSARQVDADDGASVPAQCLHTRIL